METQAISDTASVHQMLDADMFPTLRPVFQVALTIPVSSCSCERSFSALRRLHTWLRSTMKQDWLNDLAIMMIEKENLAGITRDGVIDRFAQLKPALCCHHRSKRNHWGRVLKGKKGQLKAK